MVKEQSRMPYLSSNLIDLYAKLTDTCIIVMDEQASIHNNHKNNTYDRVTLITTNTYRRLI